MDLLYPARLVFHYERLMSLAFAMSRQTVTALLLGVGGAAMWRFMHAYLPDCAPTLVDADEAIVAIAPVTDLTALKEERRYWSDAALVSDFVGSGPHMHDGSPIEHAKAFRAPVLLFHGTSDRNVSVEESKSMAAALRAATVPCDLVVYPDRDHYLEDSEVRADMLRKSDAFLRHAFGM